MKASRAWPLPLLLAAAVACGPSREEERQDRIEKICERLVGQTVRDGEEALGQFAYLPAGNCRTDWTQLSANDVCAYDATTSVCLLGWNFESNDPNACSSRGCWYACLVHAKETDLAEHQADARAPICASRFVEGQPYPVVR